MPAEVSSFTHTPSSPQLPALTCTSAPMGPGKRGPLGHSQDSSSVLALDMRADPGWEPASGCPSAALPLHMLRMEAKGLPPFVSSPGWVVGDGRLFDTCTGLQLDWGGWLRCSQACHASRAASVSGLLAMLVGQEAAEVADA